MLRRREKDLLRRCPETSRLRKVPKARARHLRSRPGRRRLQLLRSQQVSQVNPHPNSRRSHRLRRQPLIQTNRLQNRRPRRHNRIRGAQRSNLRRNPTSHRLRPRRQIRRTSLLLLPRRSAAKFPCFYEIRFLPHCWFGRIVPPLESRTMATLRVRGQADRFEEQSVRQSRSNDPAG